MIEPQGMNIDGKVHTQLYAAGSSRRSRTFGACYRTPRNVAPSSNPTDFFEPRRASDLSVQSQDTWPPRWLASVGPWSLVE
jgi:hypothetical protein